MSRGTPRARLAALLAACLPAISIAAPGEAGEAIVEAEAAPSVRFQVLFDNDGTFVKPNELEDRHYTNGAALALSFKSDGVASLVEGLGLPADGTAGGVLVAQEMYAPEDLSRVNPDPDDQPYAGYLYAGFYAQREAGGWLDHVQLDLGVVGPASLAEETQQFVHDYISGDEPFGWDAQLGNEAAVNLTLRRSLRIDAGAALGAAPAEAGGFGFELIPSAELRLGTVHRDATLSGLARIGWNLPDDFGPADVHDPGAFTGAGPRRGWSVYGFVAAGVRAVEWNTFLDGNYAQDPSPSVSPEPFVGEFAGGFAIAHTSERLRLELAYQQRFLTHEFKEQRDSNGIGRLALSVAWGF